MDYSSLKRQAVSGAKWNGVSVIYTTVVQFATTAVLARLLSPSDFGLFGMMVLVAGLVSFVSDAGVANAIIHYQEVTREDLSTLYWLNILIGIVIFLSVLLCRSLAADYFREPRLLTYLPVLGVNFVVLSVGQQFSVLLRKDLNFSALAWINAVCVTFGSFIAIILGVSGFGIWSLVVRPVASAGMQSCILLRVGKRNSWLPGFHFRAMSVRRFLKFGLFQMGQRFVDYLSANVDYLVVGRYLGPHELGIYSLAYALITVPLKKINPILVSVAFPAFAKIQFDNEKLRKGYLKILRYNSALSFPILAGLFAVAPLFIPIVYGENWIGAVPVLRVLCIIGGLYSLGNPIGSLLLAKGRADLGFYFNAVKLGIMLVANVVGVNWGIVGVAWSSLIAIVVIIWPMDFFLRWYTIEMKISEYFSSFMVFGLLSVSMAFLVWGAGHLALWGENESVRLVLEVGFGVFVYGVSMWAFARPFCRELKKVFSGSG